MSSMQIEKLFELIQQSLTANEIKHHADFIFTFNFDNPDMYDIWWSHPLYVAMTDVVWQCRKIDYVPDVAYNKLFETKLNATNN